jgi:hypothetical protein
VNTYVKVAWAYPNDSSAPILEYAIQIAAHDGTYIVESNFCNGKNPAVVLSRYCFIPVASVLRQQPYNLVFKDPVYAIIKARNIIGWADSYSNENTVYATIQVEPFAMQAPTRGSLTNARQIQIMWSALTGDNTGGSAIQSYNL